MKCSALAALLLCLSCQGVAAQGAQRGSSDPLAEAERLLNAHQYAAARAEVSRFWSMPADSIRGDRRARALMMRSVLAESLDDAETDLLRISVEHPQSEEADRALMRLAQARRARGDEDGAAIYLQRLVRDYPTSSHRTRARDQLGLGPEPRADRVSPPAVPARPAAAPPPSPSRPNTGEGETTIEIGRFPSVREAESLRDAARAAGFPAFLARVGRSGNTVVRVGSYHDRDAAESVARRVRQAGFRAEITTVVIQ